MRGWKGVCVEEWVRGCVDRGRVRGRGCNCGSEGVGLEGWVRGCVLIVDVIGRVARTCHQRIYCEMKL